MAFWPTSWTTLNRSAGPRSPPGRDCVWITSDRSRAEITAWCTTNRFRSPDLRSTMAWSSSTSRTSTALTQRSSVNPVGEPSSSPYQSAATASSTCSGDEMTRSGSPNDQSLPSGHSIGRRQVGRIAPLGAAVDPGGDGRHLFRD